MKKKKEAIIPKTSGWCLLLWYSLPGNNIRLESEEIIIIIIIMTIIIIIIKIVIITTLIMLG